MTEQHDPEVLLAFFLTVARYDHALKLGGFWACRPGKVQPNRVESDVEADRAAFAAKLPQDFVSQATGSLAEACERLLRVTPPRLVAVHDRLAWQAFPGPPSSGVTPKHLLDAIHNLRNNLFHGDSLSSLHGYQPSALDQLLRDAKLVLETLVALEPSVLEAYLNATL